MRPLGVQLWAVLLGVSSGCAQLGTALRDDRTTAELTRDGQAQHLPLVDPLRLPSSTSDLAVQEVGLNGTPKQRMDRLRRWLRDADPEFVYSEDRSYAAGRFYEVRQGDCFSFTNIFVALARALGVDARYVYVRDIGDIHEVNGQYMDDSHIAAEFGTGPRPEVVDYFRNPDEHTLAEFRELTDLEAAALFNSNLAVGHMLLGRTELAESILRFLVGEAPEMPELKNNLAVALLYNHRLPEARALLQEALAEFPTFAPLYTNALSVATAQGDERLAQSLEISGQAVADDDPLFVFGEGILRYQRQDFRGAVERFQRVTHLREQSALAWAWLSRAEDAAGDADDSTRAQKQALTLGSTNPRVLAVLLPLRYPRYHRKGGLTPP